MDSFLSRFSLPHDLVLQIIQEVQQVSGTFGGDRHRTNGRVCLLHKQTQPTAHRKSERSAV